MRVLNLQGWWPAALAGAAAPLLLLLAQPCLGPRPTPRFGSVQELQAWAASRGLHCRSDWQDGRVTAALAVSPNPLSWEQVGRLCPGAGGHGPRWRGVLWAVNRSPALDRMPAPVWNGECRVWGDVLVTGDPTLLDRLERDAR